MRRISLLLAGVLALAGSPAGAEEAGGSIVLRGSRSAHIDVKLPRIKVECCDLRATPQGVTYDGFSSSTKGSYVGFAIERIPQHKIIVGAVHAPGLDLGGGDVPTFSTLGQGGWLAPGRYRIHLLTDGRSTVRIEVGSGAAIRRSLRPRVATDAKGRVLPIGLGTLAPAGQARAEMAVKRGTHAVLMSKIDAEAGQVDYLSQCVTEIGATCQDADRHDEDLYPCPGCSGSAITLARHYPPRSLERGRREAVFTAATAGVTRDSRAFVFTITP